MMYIGRNIIPIEYDRFIRGRGVYVDDIKIDNVVFLKIIRSQYPRAKINKVDFSHEKALLFITSKDINGKLELRVDPEVSKFAKLVPMPILAGDRVNFVGQPIAAIVGEDRYVLEDLVDYVSIDYEPLKPVIDPLKATSPEAPLIHEEVPRNLCIDRRFRAGDQKIFKEAPIVVNTSLNQSRIVSNPIEPKACLAIYNNGILTLYATTQNPFRVRSELHNILKLPIDRIRVISPDVGGGFGVKVPLHPEYVIASYAAIKLKRPVKWVETRSEHIVSPYHGRGVYFDVKGYVSRDGKVLGIKGNVIVDLGAYNYSINHNIAVNIIKWITGPYSIKAVDIDLKAVFTNKTPFNAYRGAGKPEAALIYERLMDAVADALNIDRGVVRSINMLSGSGIYRNPFNIAIDVTDYKDTFSKAYKIYRDLKHRYLNKKNNKYRYGVGISAFIELDRAYPGEWAKLQVSNGKIIIYVGTHSHGQMHSTTLAQIAAEELKIPMDLIEIKYGDTEFIRDGGGTSGSRSIVIAGAAVVDVCRKFKHEAYKNGYRSVEDAVKAMEGYTIETYYKGENIFSFGAHVAVVSIDVETGMIKVVDYYAISDVGRAINPEVVKGQIIGGVIQGAGQALWEAIHYSDDGYPLCSSIAECGVPTSIEAFNVNPIIVENPSHYPHGARGVGEAGTIGAPPAIISAVEDALDMKFKVDILPIRFEDIYRFIYKRQNDK